MGMIMEDWWNNTDRGNPKYSEKNLPQSYFTTNFTWTESESKPGLSVEKPATNLLSHGRPLRTEIRLNHV